ncbi:unnamed protein product [Ambrosiozyma monospora]|uniref:Unnamed protein product n=1 Tax=Ambrosiozyma monospora TaxID=43982 RepID=A0ACB5U6E4_AMBMO|nr:unnamed protein product [Ambrosiozyma monospora]
MSSNNSMFATGTSKSNTFIVPKVEQDDHKQLYGQTSPQNQQTTSITSHQNRKSSSSKRKSSSSESTKSKKKKNDNSSNQDHHPLQQPQQPQNPPAGHRPVTSCTHCRQHKIKCNASERFPNPCSRCERMDLKCEIDPQFRPKKEYNAATCFVTKPKRG